MEQVKIGDRVMYSREWLRSTAQYTGEVPFRRGTVTKLNPFGLATVAWDDIKGERNVLAVNLVRADRLAFEAR